MKNTLICAFASMIVMLISTIQAGTTIIDFGPSSPGAPNDEDGYIVLTDQLSSYGITFSSDHDVYWLGPTYTWEPAQYSITAGYHLSSQDNHLIKGVDPIRVDFEQTVIEASIRGFDGGGDIDTLFFKAFNRNDILVDSMSLSNNFDKPGHVVSVKASEIAYITFEVSVPGDHGLFFDELTYTVPEPSTILFLGIGGLSLLRRLTS